MGQTRRRSQCWTIRCKPAEECKEIAHLGRRCDRRRHQRFRVLRFADDIAFAQEVQFTVEDLNVFNTPWSGQATYSRADDLWVENVCAENTFEYYNNRDTSLPTAAKPDF